MYEMMKKREEDEKLAAYEEYLNSMENENVLLAEKESVSKRGVIFVKIKSNNLSTIIFF